MATRRKVAKAACCPGFLNFQQYETAKEQGKPGLSVGVVELDMHFKDESGTLARSSGVRRRRLLSCSVCLKLSAEVRWTVGLGLRTDTG